MNSSPTHPGQLLDLRQAAREYAISRPTLWRWIRCGRLPAFRPFASPKFLVKRRDLEALIEASRIEHRDTRAVP
jgi:excisionase family DNA binding protein